MSVCLHGNLCREIYTKTGFIYSSKCPSNCSYFEKKYNKGHWIIKDGKEQGYDIGGIKTWYIQIMCDKCGFIKTAIEGHTGQYHYCPNCGSRMVEPQESEVEDIEIECNTCKYDNKECWEEPCKSCNVGRDTHYEPIDE